MIKNKKLLIIIFLCFSKLSVVTGATSKEYQEKSSVQDTLDYILWRECFDVNPSFQRIEDLISQGVNPYSIEEDGKTLFMYLVERKKMEVLVRLIEYSIKYKKFDLIRPIGVDKKNRETIYFLSAALTTKNYALLELLFKHFPKEVGNFINIPLAKRATPLHYLINSLDPKFKLTAIERGNTFATIEFLISHGADINAQDIKGNTARNLADKIEDLPAELRVSLNLGMPTKTKPKHISKDMDARAKFWFICLEEGPLVTKDHRQLLRKLFTLLDKFKIDLNSGDGFNNTLLERVVDQADKYQSKVLYSYLVTLLIDNGPELIIGSKLHGVIQKQALYTVISREDNAGKKILFETLIRRLLLDVDLKSEKDNVLQILIKSGDMELVIELLDYMAKNRTLKQNNITVNSLDQFNATSLGLALELDEQAIDQQLYKDKVKNKKKIIEQLIALGADTSKCSRYGDGYKSALEYAKEFDCHESIIKLLSPKAKQEEKNESKAPAGLGQPELITAEIDWSELESYLSLPISQVQNRVASLTKEELDQLLNKSDQSGKTLLKKLILDKEILHRDDKIALLTEKYEPTIDKDIIDNLAKYSLSNNRKKKLKELYVKQNSQLLLSVCSQAKADNDKPEEEKKEELKESSDETLKRSESPKTTKILRRPNAAREKERLALQKRAQEIKEQSEKRKITAQRKLAEELAADNALMRNSIEVQNQLDELSTLFDRAQYKIDRENELSDAREKLEKDAKDKSEQIELAYQTQLLEENMKAERNLDSVANILQEAQMLLDKEAKRSESLFVDKLRYKEQLFKRLFDAIKTQDCLKVKSIIVEYNKLFPVICIDDSNIFYKAVVESDKYNNPEIEACLNKQWKQLGQTLISCINISSRSGDFRRFEKLIASGVHFYWWEKAWEQDNAPKAFIEEVAAHNAHLAKYWSNIQFLTNLAFVVQKIGATQKLKYIIDRLEQLNVALDTIKNSAGDTLLISSIKDNQPEVVRFLLNLGSTVYQTNLSKQTPLSLALELADKGDSQIVSILQAIPDYGPVILSNLLASKNLDQKSTGFLINYIIKNSQKK